MSATSGFDLAVQLSEGVLNRLLQILYLNEVFPHSVKESFDRYGFQGSADIVVKPPSLNFEVNEPALINPVEFCFPLKATVILVSPQSEAFTTEAELRVTAEVYKKTELVNGKTFHYFDVSFANIPDHRFSLTTAAQKYQMYANLLKYLVTETLKTQVLSVPLAPAVPAGSGPGQPTLQSIQMRIYNDTGAANLNCLALFINLTAKPEPQPVVEVFLPQETDYAVAISTSVFQEQLSEVMNERFPGGLPATLPEDDSVTLESMNFSMENGYIALSGEFSKDVGWVSADCSFTGKVWLSVNHQGDLVAEVDNLEIDAPGWVDFLQAILPILNPLIGPFISLAIDSALRKGVSGGISSQSLGWFSKMALFAEDLPVAATSGSGDRPRMQARNRKIEVRPDALLLSGAIVFFRQDDETGKFIGNASTKELHLRDEGACKWRWMIGIKNERLFDGIVEALFEGYNGCWYCLRWYDADQFQEKETN